MPPTDPISPTVFASHPIYRVLAALSAAAVLLLAWQLRGGPEMGTLFFLGISLVLALRFGRMAAASVTLDRRGVALRLPWRAARTVAFGQLVAVHEGGRGLKSILLLYHPRAGDGRMDLDDLHTLSLPAVSRQDELLTALLHRIPR